MALRDNVAEAQKVDVLWYVTQDEVEYNIILQLLVTWLHIEEVYWVLKYGKISHGILYVKRRVSQPWALLAVCYKLALYYSTLQEVLYALNIKRNIFEPMLHIPAL